MEAQAIMMHMRLLARRRPLELEEMAENMAAVKAQSGIFQVEAVRRFTAAEAAETDTTWDHMPVPQTAIRA